MKQVVAWRRLDVAGAEYAEVDREPTRLAGQVILVDDGSRWSFAYRVACAPSDATSWATIDGRRDGTAFALARRPEGTWTVDGRPAPELAGLLDVDISMTPATNTLPIRRLRLEPGARAEVTAAWVSLPSLEVKPLRQSYRRRSASLYDYESPAFRAELTVDAEGLVVTYGELWARA